MAQTEIATVNEVLAFLSLSSTVTDDDKALIAMLKTGVENDCRQFVGHGITKPSSDYTHFLPAQNNRSPEEGLVQFDLVGGKAVPISQYTSAGSILVLPQMFVRAITSIYEDRAAYAGFGSNAFASSTLLTAGTDYYLDIDSTGMSLSGHVIRIGTCWSTEPRSIKAVYSAGLTFEELRSEYSFVRDSVILEVIQRFKMVKAQQGATSDGWAPIKSESFGQEYSVTYATDLISKMFGSLSQRCQDSLSTIVNWNQAA